MIIYRVYRIKKNIWKYEITHSRDLYIVKVIHFDLIDSGAGVLSEDIAADVFVSPESVVGVLAPSSCSLANFLLLVPLPTATTFSIGKTVIPVSI